jgi:hypothetical protein
VVKNKVAPPFKEVEFDIMYGHGISREGDVLDLGSAEGVIDKSGTWFSFGGERIGQGREQAKTFLREHPETLAQIEAKLFERFGVKARGAGGGASDLKGGEGGGLSCEGGEAGGPLAKRANAPKAQPPAPPDESELEKKPRVKAVR